MDEQIILSREALAANVASVRLLARVGSHVNLQLVTGVIRGAALFAVVVALFQVSLSVNGQIVFFVEALIAQIAAVRFFARVRHLMKLKRF